MLSTSFYLADKYNKTRMKTLIVSDVHIGRKDSSIKKLANFIELNPSERIILNGDIFDQFAIWKDKGKLLKEHWPHVKRMFIILKNRRTKIFYLVGNHDYLAFLLVPFGFFLGMKIRKRFRSNGTIVEHGDWVKQYLKIRKFFNKEILVGNDYHENCNEFGRIKNKYLIVGHSHVQRSMEHVYDEGDWVGDDTFLFIDLK